MVQVGEGKSDWIALVEEVGTGFIQLIEVFLDFTGDHKVVIRITHKGTDSKESSAEHA